MIASGSSVLTFAVKPKYSGVPKVTEVQLLHPTVSKPVV